jgi:TonB family protein
VTQSFINYNKIIVIFGILISFQCINCYSQTREDLSILTCQDSVNKACNKENQNRTLLYLPTPIYTSKHSGKVVITVWISKDGLILKAQVDSLKSSTLKKELIQNALNVVYKARFSSIEKDTVQTTSVTFNYLRK